LLSNLGNYKYYIPGLYRNLNKLSIPRPIAKAKTKIKFVIRAIIIRKETSIVEETLTIFRNNKEYSNKKYKLGKLASINILAIENKIISNTENFVNTVFYQSLDNDLYYIN